MKNTRLVGGWKTRLVLLLFGFVAFEVFAQGTFQNLDFENPTFVPTNGFGANVVLFQPAFPNWTGYINQGSTPIAISNSISIGGGASFSIMGPGAPAGTMLQGNYTALLQVGGNPSQGPDIALAQSGLVPAHAHSLHFLADPRSHPGLSVTMNGQPLGISILNDFGSYKEYGADISGFAGQNAELRFAMPNVAGSSDILFLDGISFSQTGVPEPSSWALFALGGALFWCAARRNRK